MVAVPFSAVFWNHLSHVRRGGRLWYTVAREDLSSAAVLNKWQGSHQDGFIANAGDHLGDLGSQRDVENRNRRVIP